MTSFPEENHDLFNQGKSTGSGLFDLGDEASDGHGSACLDDFDPGFSNVPPGSRFDPDESVAGSSGASWETLHVFDVVAFNGHLDRAWHTLDPPSIMKFPWECGIWNDISGYCDRASLVVAPKLVRPPIVQWPDLAPAQQPVEKSRRREPVPQ